MRPRQKADYKSAPLSSRITNPEELGYFYQILLKRILLMEFRIIKYPNHSLNDKGVLSRMVSGGTKQKETRKWN
jgi:hypothetical protein